MAALAVREHGSIRGRRWLASTIQKPKYPWYAVTVLSPLWIRVLSNTPFEQQGRPAQQLIINMLDDCGYTGLQLHSYQGRLTDLASTKIWFPPLTHLAVSTQLPL